MIFKETTVAGAVLIEPERLLDARGFFTRTFCVAEFKAHGLNPHVVQCSVSASLKSGTLRGMHYQAAPYEETKLVRCTRGAIYDVVIDLRPGSPTYLRHLAVELNEENRLALYVPGQCAHGFVTLRDHTEVFYQMSEFFAPNAATGVRWNDPAFGISWPVVDPILSDRDRHWPDYHKANQVTG